MSATMAENFDSGLREIAKQSVEAMSDLNGDAKNVKLAIGRLCCIEADANRLLDDIPPAESESSCWFIERGGGEWWTGDARIAWTRDPHRAVRFCRRQDADAVILGRDTNSTWQGFATEHGFLKEQQP